MNVPREALEAVEAIFEAIMLGLEDGEDDDVGRATHVLDATCRACADFGIELRADRLYGMTVGELRGIARDARANLAGAR